MDVPEKKNAPRAHQFLQPEKALQSDERTENDSSSPRTETGKSSIAPLLQLPTTSKQSAVPLFQAPTTDRQSVPAPSPLSTTGSQHTPSLLRLPLTDRQTALPAPPSLTDKRATPSLSRFQAVPKQDRPLPVSAPMNAYSVPQVQPRAPRKPSISTLDKSTPFIAVLFNLIVLVAVVWMTQSKTTLPFSAHQSSTQVHTTAPALNTITNNKNISPLIFGTNMALFHENDEVLKSATTRQLLKDIGVRVIRMPTRASLSPQTEVQAAQAIKEIGAVPLVVISGPESKEGSLLDTDENILSLLMPVFGNELVYFEFGNESDLNGVNADQYVASWNLVIPSLKEKFPNARFIAPDNYQFSRRYLKTFLQHAQPLPDGVSWHEYTCSVNWTADFCLSLLNMWPIHFAQARAAMREAIGKELPIWISEWNYAADQQVNNGQPINDGKYNNPIFMRNWTTLAMQMLIENRVFAALQYFSTNQPMALVSRDKISYEGAVFQQEYQNVMVKGISPPVMTVSEPPATPPKTPLTVSFQNGVSTGWSTVGAGITQPVISSEKSFAGPYSLKITLSNASEDSFPSVNISHNNLAKIPGPGQMINAYVYADNKAALVNAKLYVAEPNGSWLFSGDIALTPGQWNKVWYALPVNFNAQVAYVGIQFFTSHPGVSNNVYIGGLNIG